MYVIRRDGVVAVALVLLSGSLIFSRGQAAPSSEAQQTPPRRSNTTEVDRGSNHTQNSSAQPNVDGGDLDDADANERKASVKPVDEKAGVLYFEIRKRFDKCNLTLDKIQSVLSEKDDDRFTNMLADKLGYVVDGNIEDPHIPVIKSHRGDMIELLKMRKVLLIQRSLRLHHDSSAPSVKLHGRTGYEVAKKIHSLGAKTVDSLLHDYTLSGSLGYAVGVALGYSDGDEHMKYLEATNEAEMREVLQQVLKSTMPKIGFEVAKKIQSLETDAIIELLDDYTLSGSLGYAVGVALGYLDGDEHVKYLENADEARLRKQLQQVLKSKMPSVTTPTSQKQGVEERSKPIHVQSKGNLWTEKGERTRRAKSEVALYFEITKRMNECNLSCDEIRLVLSTGKDEDQFMYILADKLGYIVDGNYGDPHIAVIKSHKDDLITLLEERETLLRPLSQTSDQESSVSTEPPKVKAPVVKHKGQISFEVVNKIRSLGADAIYELLNDYTLSGSLGYAVGLMLGYPNEDEHVKYLENADEAKLRKALQQVLKSKMHDRNEPTSEIVELPKQDEGKDSAEPQETEMLPTTSEVRRVDVSNGGTTSEVSALDRQLSSNKQDQRDSNEGTQDETEHDKDYDEDDNQDSLTNELAFFKDDEFMAYLKSDYEELYHELRSWENQLADEDDHFIMKAMDEYQKWTESKTKNEKEANSNVANQEDNSAEPADMYRVEGEQTSSNHDDKHASSSSLEPWHFVLIFLILGGVIVIGALSVPYMRKRQIYDGVMSHVKRQKRAEEYEPLI